jgi:hypothetical protein
MYRFFIRTLRAQIRTPGQESITSTDSRVPERRRHNLSAVLQNFQLSWKFLQIARAELL